MLDIGFGQPVNWACLFSSPASPRSSNKTPSLISSIEGWAVSIKVKLRIVETTSKQLETDQIRLEYDLAGAAERLDCKGTQFGRGLNASR